MRSHASWSRIWILIRSQFQKICIFLIFKSFNQFSYSFFFWIRKKIPFWNTVVSQSTIDAYDIATRLEVSESNEEIPLYQKINEELSVKYKGQQKVYESQLNENIPLRIESHLPVSFWCLLNIFRFCRQIKSYSLFMSFPVLLLIEVESPVDGCEQSKGDREKKPNIYILEI